MDTSGTHASFLFATLGRFAIAAAIISTVFLCWPVAGWTQPAIGTVTAENRTRATVLIMADSYRDRYGDLRSLSGSWRLGPGEEVFLLVNNRRIEARQFTYRLSDSWGQTRWFIDVARNYDDGRLSLVVGDQLIAQHVQKRQQAITAAVANMVGAIIAQGVATSGNPDQDTFGDIIARGLALALKEALIEKAIENLFWFYDAFTKATAQRVTTLLIEGRLTFDEFARATQRDALIATLRREAPGLAGLSDVVEFADKVREARERARRRY